MILPLHTPSDPTRGSSTRCTSSTSPTRPRSARAGRSSSTTTDRTTPRRRAPVAAAPAVQVAPAAPAPAAAAPAAPTAPAAPVAPADVEAEPLGEPLRGAAALIATNMVKSLEVPTATSFREVPARLLEVNRSIINGYLGRTGRGKVSFTHLIGYAVVRAISETIPAMNASFVEGARRQAARSSATRTSVSASPSTSRRPTAAPCSCRASRTPTRSTSGASGRPTTTSSARSATTSSPPTTSPGSPSASPTPAPSAPCSRCPGSCRARASSSASGRSTTRPSSRAPTRATLANLGVSKIITISSTYDHRIIQGAESGLFLKQVHELLLGGDDFYEEIFRSIGVPYEAVQWRRDVNPVDQQSAMLEKQMQVDQLINTHRVRGHLIADLDPLSAEDPVMHPELDPAHLRAHHLGPRPRVPRPTRIGGHDRMALGEILHLLRDAYCRTVGIEYMHIQEPAEKALDPAPGRGRRHHARRRRAAPHPRPAERGRGAREVPRHQVPRAEALRHRRRRVGHPDPRLAARLGGRRPHGLRRPGHGPPRPAQRAGEHRRQVLRAALQGVRGQRRPRVHPGLRRREVPPRPDRQVRQPGRQHHRGRAGRQPVAPRDRRPGRRGHGPGQDGPHRSARAATRCCRS